MTTKGSNILSAGLLILMLTACASSTPYLDQNRGKAFEQARYSQLLNPDANVSTEPVEGLDGRESERLETKYLDTFKTKQPRPVYNINMPGVTSGK
jgi:hypothetical protein